MTHRFERVGGDAALDFVNTIHDWTVEAPRDYLAAFADAVRFGEQSGVLAPPEARRLAAEPGGKELERLRQLRAALQRIFSAASAGRAPTPADLDYLADEAAAAAPAARLQPTRRGVVRTLDPGAAGAAVLRYRLAEAAVALLTSPGLARVKSCPSCGWLFVDTSKNRSRRWCSMRTCGAAAKAHRYYWRSRRAARSGRHRATNSPK